MSQFLTQFLTQLNQNISTLRTDYNQALGVLNSKKADRTKKTNDLTQAQTDIECWQQVQTLLGWVAEESREQLKKKIEETVTAALQAIFNDDRMEFRIDIRSINGKPAAEWSVVSMYGDTKVSANPEDSRGGGVTDIVSLALRLAMLELARPKPQGAIFLDEVGKHVSAEFAPNVAAFLKQYAAKTGRQIILITHQAALAEVADVSYQVSQTDGISEVSAI